MKNGILLLLLLSAVAMGFLLGRHSVTGSRSSTSQHEVPLVSGSNTASSGTEKESDASHRKLSLAQIEERIRGLKMSDYHWGSGAPRAWLELIAQISAADMPEVMDFVSKNCAHNLQKALRTGLCEHWADIDPKNALNFARNLSNKLEQDAAVSIVISAWTANDPKAATEWAKQLPGGTFRNKMLNNVISALATSDPDAALALYQTSGASFFRNEFPPYFIFQSIFGAWASENPQEAIAKAAQLASPSDRSAAHEVIATSWAAIDPRAALAWARTLPSGEDRFMAMQNVLFQWGRDEPAGAADYLHQLPDGRAKDGAIYQIDRQLAASDPKKALSLAETMRGDGVAKQNLIRDAIAQWASQDQAGALAYAQHLPPGSERDVALQSALQTLAMTDPKTAYSLIDQLPQGQAQTDVINSVASGMAQTDPDGALKFAMENLKAQGQLNIFLSNLASDWVRKDPDAAKSWWQNVPEGPSRQSFIDGLVSTLIENSAQDAANFVSALPASEQSWAVGSLAMRWARDDPESTAKWAAGLSDPKTQMAAYQNLILGWSGSDPAKTSEWLSALPDDQTRQSLAQTFVSYLGGSHPAIAAPWAASLADANDRNRAIENVARSWLQTDTASAKEWLVTTSLPDDLKQRLLKNY